MSDEFLDVRILDNFHQTSSFLNRVIAGMVAEAKKEGVTIITAALMDQVQNKRSGEH
jgi:hypothetical protein